MTVFAQKIQNSFGGFYQNTYDYVKSSNQNNDDLKANDVPYDHLQNSGTRRDSNFRRLR